MLQLILGAGSRAYEYGDGANEGRRPAVRFRHTPPVATYMALPVLQLSVDRLRSPKFVIPCAENELRPMTMQCLSGRRFGDLKTLLAKLSAWSLGR